MGSSITVVDLERTVQKKNVCCHCSAKKRRILKCFFRERYYQSISESKPTTEKERFKERSNKQLCHTKNENSLAAGQKIILLTNLSDNFFIL